MMPPSLATRVSTRDTNMLTTNRIKQMQKWVPAAQTKHNSDSALHDLSDLCERLRAS